MTDPPKNSSLSLSVHGRRLRIDQLGSGEGWILRRPTCSKRRRRTGGVQRDRSHRAVHRASSSLHQPDLGRYLCGRLWWVYLTLRVISVYPLMAGGRSLRRVARPPACATSTPTRFSFLRGGSRNRPSCQVLPSVKSGGGTRGNCNRLHV
jgi:hypothetical protein